MSMEKVRDLLFEKSSMSLVLLIDLAPLLPESFLGRAICLAKNATEPLLQAFVVRALARCLPSRDERRKLMRVYTVPRGCVLKDVCIPAGKEARRLIAVLSEEERYEVFDQLLSQMEHIGGMVIDPEENLRHYSDSVKLDETNDDDSIIDPSENQPVVPGWESERSSDPPENQRTGSDWRSYDPPDNRHGGSDHTTAAKIIVVGDDNLVVQPGQPKKRSDIVNLGFSLDGAADKSLRSNQPLLCGKSYYFWLNIGSELKDSIGTGAPLGIEKLPQQAHLKVAIFAFENELDITPGEDVGELQIQADGTVKVARQPTGKKADSIPLSPKASFEHLDLFLLFPVKAPKTEGPHRLRCNIYCEQILVQSYLVSALVKNDPAPIEDSCSSKLDYALSQTLRPSHLANMTTEPHLLSLMINSNGNGSHNFRFFGTDGKESFKDDAQVDGELLAGFLKQARRAMHKVSWGKEDEWDEAKQWKYRYQVDSFDRAKLAKDLAYLARAGWRIYNGFLQHLSTTAAQLEDLMAKPGLLQIALKLSPRAVLPAAVVYDYHWKPDKFDDFDNTPFELCPTFSAAIDRAGQGGPPLEECDCFKGGCALKAEIATITKSGSTKTLLDLPPIICPSGFWGYRHSVGLPLTLDGTNNDAPAVIGFKDDLQVIAGVSTDPLFVERDSHLGRLKALRTALNFEQDEGYGQVVRHLKMTIPHLLYFYCHGGIRANTNLPYLEIGKSDRFGPEDLVGEGISWKEPNPLVFINGCHTTSLNPEIALDFVSAFVQQGGAAGVLGTEITVFEPLAAKFAEECLRRFLGAPPFDEGMPIGKAVRGARLELLRLGNPLGLVYIPFAVASLRLEKVSGN